MLLESEIFEELFYNTSAWMGLNLSEPILRELFSIVLAFSASTLIEIEATVGVGSLTVISPAVNGGIVVFPNWLVAICNMPLWKDVTFVVADSMTVTGGMVRSSRGFLMNLSSSVVI